MGCLWSSAWRPFGPPKLRYNCLGLTDEDNSVSRTDNFVNVNVFNTVTSARVLSYRWVLHYFSTIPVGRIKIVTIYKRSIFQVEWLIATLILCISHCSESDSVSSRVFYSAVSTAPRFLFFLVLSVTWPRPRSAKCWSGHLITKPVMFSRQKLLIHQYTKMLHILFSLLCVKYIFFWFY